jgi:hypothetical protein
MSECPSWVNCVALTTCRLLPVYPDKQTFSETTGMSQKCQHRKWAISFDHRSARAISALQGVPRRRFVGSDWQACLKEASLVALAVDFALVVLGG